MALCRAALLVLAVCLSAASAAAAQGAARARPRAVDAARQAQRGFESFRRMRAPLSPGSGPCEERIGRFCYWDNNGEGTPPREPEEVGARRRRLVERLGAAAAAAPRDDWVAGQHVRYLVEDARLPEAAAAARACAGTPWWCVALLGLARHEASDHSGAAAAFDSALALMPPEQRCAWTDVSSWMADGAGEYRKLACGAPRDSATRRFTWLARPLWMLPGDDALAELLSRRVMTRVLSQSPVPYALSWGRDLEELTVRYGWPVAWSRVVSGMAEVSAIGHEPTPSYDVTPSARALRRPADAEAEDWEPKRRLARMRYAPRHLRRRGALGPLEHQLVFFRRGDSLLVAAAYELGADSAWARGDARVGLVIAAPGRELARAVRDSAPAAGVLLARMPREAGVASVEAWSPGASFAARSRYGVRPPAADARLSSLAVLRAPPPAAAPTTEEVLRTSLGTRAVRAGDAVHLYWEAYGAPGGDSAEVSLTMARVGVGLLGRAAARVRLAPRARPVRMRWSETAGGGAGRALALRIPDLPTGTYRIELAVDGEVAATTVRVTR